MITKLASLAREIREVIPGTESVTVYPSGESVLVVVATDYHVRELAAQYGTLTVVREPLVDTWLECVVMVDGIAITVSGPHTDIEQTTEAA